MKLLALYSNRISQHFDRFVRLAEFFGIVSIPVQIADFAARFPMGETDSDNRVVVVCDVGEIVNRDNCEAVDLIQLLTHRASTVLGLIPEVVPRYSDFLRRATGNAIQGVYESQSDLKLTFPDLRELDPQNPLACYRVPRKSSRPFIAFAVREAAEIARLMAIGKDPTFIRCQSNDCEFFVWAVPEILDIHSSVETELEFEGLASRFVPAVVFIRTNFGDRSWHPVRHWAGILIGDPLLKRRYGYMNFPQILKSASDHHYHISLAFILWNWKRTTKRNSRLFKSHQSQLSLCIHGCDHTNNEFGTADYTE